MRILEKYKVYPDLLSSFCLQDVGKGREQELKLWLDIFVQLARTACKPMNNIDFCLLEQSERKSLSQNPGFGCNFRTSENTTPAEPELDQ